jgi:hypothetical protein
MARGSVRHRQDQISATVDQSTGGASAITSILPVLTGPARFAVLTILPIAAIRPLLAWSTVTAIAAVFSRRRRIGRKVSLHCLVKRFWHRKDRFYDLLARDGICIPAITTWRAIFPVEAITT